MHTLSNSTVDLRAGTEYVRVGSYLIDRQLRRLIRVTESVRWTSKVVVELHYGASPSGVYCFGKVVVAERDWSDKTIKPTCFQRHGEHNSEAANALVKS
jgi:hypothetical protein